jgi:hypothetical protein
LDEVGKMEVWMDSVADKVSKVKEKLEHTTDEIGDVYFKDS